VTTTEIMPQTVDDEKDSPSHPQVHLLSSLVRKCAVWMPLMWMRTRSGVAVKIADDDEIFSTTENSLEPIFDLRKAEVELD
jgi:hypothetical protein